MGSTVSSKGTWNVRFLHGLHSDDDRYALIVLNRPFSRPLLNRLWNSTQWHCCADGGANRLFDTLQNDADRRKYALLSASLRYDIDAFGIQIYT